MKGIFVLPILMMLMLVETSVYGATFEGKVIDADTKEPIEGAVVVATWLEEQGGIAGSSSRLKDVKEALTDKNGEWVIKGSKGREMGSITAIFTFMTGTYITNPPEFIVFKPGYCSWPAGFGIDACKDKIQPEGNDKVAEGQTVELPRLINRERMTVIRNIPSLGMAAEGEDKLPLFRKLLRQEENAIRR